MKIKFARSLSPHDRNVKFKPISLLLNSREILLGYGLSDFPDNIGIQACTSEELGSFYGEGYRNTIMAFISTVIFGDNYSHSVFYLKDMDYNTTMSYVIHELGHAWIYENIESNYEKANHVLEEGFCTLLQFLFWKTVSSELAKLYLEKNVNREDVYGEGLRILLPIFEKEGLLAVVSHISVAE